MITSSLAQLSFSKILAQSKFILYHEISGADQDTTYQAVDEDRAIWGAAKSSCRGQFFHYQYDIWKAKTET